MAIQKLSKSEYEKAAKTLKRKLPIEQSPAWLEFDARLENRQPLGLFAYQPKNARQPLAIFAMTEYTQPRYTMIWIKHGPIWAKPPSAETIKSFIGHLKAYAAVQAKNSTFIRLNLPPEIHHLPNSMHNIMYEKTVVINLAKTKEERLADMTQSGRRALRKAWQASLETKELDEVTETSFAPFYKILQATASRDDFGIHPKLLYLTMLQSLKSQARLFVIYHQKQPLAWAIVTVHDKQAVYYYGASSRQARELNAPYQLHWDIMQKLKEEGVISYDFMGIASAGHEHLKNVSVFKEKFSRTTVEVSPSYDIVLQSARYKLLGLVRKTRQKLGFL